MTNSVHPHIGRASGGGFERKLAVISGAGMFLDGFDISVIAVALPSLSKELDITSGFIAGVVASSVVVGMFVGMMLGGWLADKLGRRKMYTIDLIGFVVFAVAAGLSTTVWELVLARLLLGLFIGADYPISSSLTAEFTSARRRGRMIILMSLMWQTGAFAAYLIGILFLPIGDNAWRWMFMVGALLALITLFLRSSVPESPRWLRAHYRVAEAEKIEGQMAQEHGVVVDSQFSQTGAQSRGRWTELFNRNTIRATVFCSVFWFAFGVSFYGISMYTPTILEPFTQGHTAYAYMGSAFISLLGVAGAAIGMFAVERIGRRKQMIYCFIGMCIALVIFALWESPSLIPMIVLLSITILLANLGPGVLDMVYPNEMFPTRLRGSGVGFAGAMSRVGSILGILLFPAMVTAWGTPNATWLFAAIALGGLIVTLILAPETRGRTMQDIELLASNGWRDRTGKKVVYGTYEDADARYTPTTGK